MFVLANQNGNLAVRQKQTRKRKLNDVQISNGFIKIKVLKAEYYFFHLVEDLDF